MCTINGARCENELSWPQIYPWWFHTKIINNGLKVSISKIFKKNTQTLYISKKEHTNWKNLIFFLTEKKTK
jgi:hypothetical protein